VSWKRMAPSLGSLLGFDHHVKPSLDIVEPLPWFLCPSDLDGPLSPDWMK